MSNKELLSAIRSVMEEALDEKLEEKLASIQGEICNVRIEIKEVKTDLGGVKEELKEVKTDLGGVKEELKEVKDDLGGVKCNVESLKSEVTKLNLDHENVIKPQLRLLAENYVPAAKKYEESTQTIGQMQLDIEMLKKVVAYHSEILQNIS